MRPCLSSAFEYPSGTGQVEMKMKVIVSFIGGGALSEINQAADGFTACRHRIYEPVIASGIVARHRIARDQHVRALRFPVRSHVNPVLGAVAVEKMDDQRALECLPGGH